MATTYDDIYQIFVSRCGLDASDLPNGQEKQYDLIKNGLLDFNVRLCRNVGYDDIAEQFDTDLTNGEKLLIATYMKIVILNNILTQFASDIQVYGKEIAIKFHGDNMKMIKDSIDKEEEKVEDYILFISTKL